jgi:AcrR family transcriptional regulator
MIGVVEEPGLRERKRVATRRAIQLAVLRLAIDRGLDKVTIEEISRTAGVSPRTFFNYFPSKEAAIAGDSLELPDNEEVQAFVNAGPLQSVLRGLGELLASSAEKASHDAEVQVLRRSLLKQYPPLLVMRMAAMRSYEDQLAEVVVDRLTRDDPDLARRTEDLRTKARLVTLVAFGAMRHAWACWADSGGSVDLVKRLRDTFTQLESILAPVGSD